MVCCSWGKKLSSIQLPKGEKKDHGGKCWGGSSLNFGSETLQGRKGRSCAPGVATAVSVGQGSGKEEEGFARGGGFADLCHGNYWVEKKGKADVVVDFAIFR